MEECKVVQSNSSTRTIRVQRLERDDAISIEIKVFKGVPVPAVNSYVVCSFSKGKGILIGEWE